MPPTFVPRSPDVSLRTLSRWQWTTIATLTVGYAGYYFCRSNLSVATPLLLDEFGDTLDKKAIGTIASVAVFFYAGGKFINGILADFLGGRRMFLFGMLASICATIVFGLASGFYLFMAVWCVNRFVQSMGWGALVKTASRWFPSSVMGSVLGILCLSYLFGDVAARLVLGFFADSGIGWRGVFMASAAILGVILLGSFFLLKSSPADVGEPEPAAHELNLYGESGNTARPRDLWDLLLPFFMSFSFWLVCIMNFGLTMVRESFNFWTPTYLTEVAGMTSGAGQASALFPLFGGLSVLASGYISDIFAKGKRGLVIVAFLVPSLAAIFILARMEAPASPVVPLILISAIGFLILGPYAFLTGAISVDLGGKRGSSTAAGLADTMGYIGGIVSGRFVGGLAQEHGWSGAFNFLGIVLAATTAFAVLYWYLHEYRAALKVRRQMAVSSVNRD
jgi:MFS transporter, OPA family, glycerol-3-phosphate transporter